MTIHCACKTMFDPRFNKRKPIRYVVQLARGVSEFHTVDWCAQFIRGSSTGVTRWDYANLRPQQFNRLDT